ncbi:hypothetical protein QBC39DRAFT_364910 [Podospora conica]|nr:hypothetical protein QBC39DRAFT_364910 [Schizothecium conicum]
MVHVRGMLFDSSFGLLFFLLVNFGVVEMGGKLCWSWEQPSWLVWWCLGSVACVRLGGGVRVGRG